MDSPPTKESNGKTEPSVTQPSETPLILFCKIHTDSQGRPLPYSIFGESIDENGKFHEPFYECIKCAFPEESGKVK